MTRRRHLGDLLHWIRTAAGLTRPDLSKQAGIPLFALRKIESGRAKPARFQVDRILQVPALGLPLAWSALRAMAAQNGVSIELAPALGGGSGSGGQTEGSRGPAHGGEVPGEGNGTPEGGQGRGGTKP